MRRASLCRRGGRLVLWGDPTALSPFAAQAISQNLGTDMLFPLEEVIDEEIRYLSDALLFFYSECTKPHFPSPIVFEQQEMRLFRSELQNFSQLGPFLKTFSHPFPDGCFANVALAVCGLPLSLAFPPTLL